MTATLVFVLILVSLFLLQKSDIEELRHEVLGLRASLEVVTDSQRPLRDLGGDLARLRQVVTELNHHMRPKSGGR